jgi:hypothetical protein
VPASEMKQALFFYFQKNIFASDVEIALKKTCSTEV